MFDELKRRMKADGMTDKQIEDAMYYNTGLFKGCVSRTRITRYRSKWTILPLDPNNLF